MIKVSKLAEILKSSYLPEVLDSGAQIFGAALKSPAPVNEFIKGLEEMNIPQTAIQKYEQEGLSVLDSIVKTQKGMSYNDIPGEAYIVYTGLLAREFVMGIEPKKNYETNIYTKSEKLLEMLHKEGAFDNEDKYQKNMKALFGDSKEPYGKKVVSSLKANSLAMGKLQVTAVIGDEVSLDLIIPAKFRSDYGSDFKLVPYALFPYLAISLENFVNGLRAKVFVEKNNVTKMEKKVEDIRALIVMQREEDGNLKTRKITFDKDEVLKAYARGGVGLSVDETKSFEAMVSAQIRKTKIGWDCIKKQIRVFNTEASVYSVPYSVIKLERLVKIAPCSLKDIDTSMYLIDFDEVRRLFTSRVNNWRLSEFEEFGSFLNTNDCANIDERIKKLNQWADGLADVDLWTAMKAKRPLFERMKDGSSKSIEEGLADMYKRKPTAQKRLEWVSLDTDMTKRVKQVKELLSKGICQIESVSTKTGAPRKYVATNNNDILNIVYGKNQRLAYESPKRSLNEVLALIQSGKITTLRQFLRDLHTASVDGLVDYSNLTDASTPNDFIKAIEDAFVEIQNNETKRQVSTNGYVVNFRRVNAENEKEYYGAVDVRNIEALLFGAQK